MQCNKSLIRMIAFTFTLLIVGVIVLFLSKAYHFLQNPDKNILEIITPSTFTIIKCDNLQYVKELNNEKYPYIATIFSPENKTMLASWINCVDSFVDMQSIIKKHPLYIFMAYKDKKLSYLYTWEIGKKNDGTIKNFLKSLQQQYETQVYVYKKWKIIKIIIDAKIIYANYTNGLLLFTTDEQFMYASLNQLLEPSEHASSFLKESMDTWNMNAHIHIVIRQPEIDYYMSENKMNFVDDCLWNYLSIFQIAALDVSFRNEKIIFSGYLSLDTACHQYEFYRYNNYSIDYQKLLPKNPTAIVGLIGENFSSLSTLYQLKRSVNEDFMLMMKPNTIFSFNLEADTAATYILMKSDDIEEAKFHLYNCLNSTFENNIYLLDTFYEAGLMIGGIDIANFFLTRLQIAKEIKRLKAYTVIDNYILFSDTKQHISHYANMLKENEVLSKDTNFTAMNTYFSEGSNFLYYKKTNNNQLHLDSIEKKIHSYRLQLSYRSKNKMFFHLLLQLK